METNGTRNLALLLPLFYKFAREVREGVIDWVNRNPEWRVIELHLEEVKARKAFARHIAGVVFWPRAMDCRSWKVISTWDLPTVVCGASIPADLRVRRLVNVSFDRGSIGRLAVEHFKHLGFEVAGYVGNHVMTGGELVPRASAMRELALAQGMEWVCHDIGGKDPEKSPELLWEGADSRPLRDFLRKCPKPVALLAEDDYIGAMRALWASDHADYSGEFASFSNVSSNPKPVNGTVPFVIGGHSKAAARRAGRLGDGFFPGKGSPAELAELIDIVRQTAADAGRDPEAIEITASSGGIFGSDPVAAAEEMAALGVSRLMVPAFLMMKPSEAEAMNGFAERVIAPTAGI